MANFLSETSTARLGTINNIVNWSESIKDFSQNISVIDTKNLGAENNELFNLPESLLDEKQSFPKRM